MEDKNKKNEQFIYVGAIILLVIVLSFRVASQSQRMGESIENIREEGIEFNNDYQEEDSSEEGRISFDESFSTPDNKLSFEYPSDWEEVENEDILKLFQNPEHGDVDQYMQEDMIDHEDLESLKIDEEGYEMDDAEKQEIVGEIMFLGMKTTFPNLSFGVMSVQRLDEDVDDTNDLKEIMTDEFELKQGEEKAEIINSKKGSDFVSMDVITSTGGRPVFQSKNVGFLIGDEIYILSLNAPHDNWDSFEGEFNMVISSIEINE